MNSIVKWKGVLFGMKTSLLCILVMFLFSSSDALAENDAEKSAEDYGKEVDNAVQSALESQDIKKEEKDLLESLFPELSSTDSKKESQETVAQSPQTTDQDQTQNCKLSEIIREGITEIEAEDKRHWEAVSEMNTRNEALICLTGAGLSPGRDGQWTYLDLMYAVYEGELDEEEERHNQRVQQINDNCLEKTRRLRDGDIQDQQADAAANTADQVASNKDDNNVRDLAENEATLDDFASTDFQPGEQTTLEAYDESRADYDKSEYEVWRANSLVQQSSEGGDVVLDEARYLRDRGGAEAQMTRAQSTRQAAEADAADSWNQVFWNSVQDAVIAGMTTAADSIGSTAASRVSDEVFMRRPDDSSGTTDEAQEDDTTELAATESTDDTSRQSADSQQDDSAGTSDDDQQGEGADFDLDLSSLDDMGRDLSQVDVDTPPPVEELDWSVREPPAQGSPWTPPPEPTYTFDGVPAEEIYRRNRGLK